MNWIILFIVISIILFFIIKIRIEKITMICDNCDYKEIINFNNIDNINNLLNTKCPKCGHIIINKNDMKKLKFLYKFYDPNHKSKYKSKKFHYRTKKH